MQRFLPPNPHLYERFCHILNREQPYILEGLIEEDFGAITLTVDNVKRVTAEKGKPAKRTISIYDLKRLAASPC